MGDFDVKIELHKNHEGADKDSSPLFGNQGEMFEIGGVLFGDGCSSVQIDYN